MSGENRNMMAVRLSHKNMSTMMVRMKVVLFDRFCWLMGQDVISNG